MEVLKNELGDTKATLAVILAKQEQIDELMKEITTLKDENSQHKKTITSLEKRIDDLEQYTRMDDVIISGLNLQPKSYAAASAPTAQNGPDDSESQKAKLEEQVVSFFTSKDIELSKEAISTCHHLPNAKGGIKNIILRFAQRKYKDSMLAQWKKLQGSNVYINEHLTQKTSRLAYLARKLKKNKLIINTWTRNCRVFAKWDNPDSETPTVLRITDEKNFLECNIPADELNNVISSIDAESRAKRSAHTSTRRQ